MAEDSVLNQVEQESRLMPFRDRGQRPQEEGLPAQQQSPARPRYAAPINWWKLNPIERAETLEVLGQWVPELVRRYGLRDSVVPPCWFLHEALVQELLAVFQYRNQQQVLSNAPPSAMIDFHYQFDLAIRRMTAWTAMNECNSAQHQDTVTSAWAVMGTVQGSEWVTNFEEHVRRVAAG